MVDVGKEWNENAPEWIRLSRAGYDVYRDHQNTPQFLANLPPIKGLRGIDVGCGEGTNTVLLANLGAQMTGIDISPVMIDAAQGLSSEIEFLTCDALDLEFESEVFDFATAFMSMMDMPNHARALGEIFRVLKPNGFFQFSILHPCFVPPHRKNVRDADGQTRAIQVADYFRRTNGEVEEWTFTDAKRANVSIDRPFRVPRYHRTIADWFNLLIASGFSIEFVHEPTASDEDARTYQTLQDTQIAPIFLHIRVRKS